jgi:hypothetical protein
MARPPLESHGPEGDALLDEVRAAVATLAAVLTHAPQFRADLIASIEAGRRDVERRLSRGELVFVVIGEEHAGKATFLNALLGVRVLGQGQKKPDAVTFLRYADAPDFRAHFRKGPIEEFSKSVPDESAALLEQLEPIEAALAAADAERGEAERDAATAAQALQRDESALAEASRAVTAAHDEASKRQRAARDADDGAKQLTESAADAHRALPMVVRTRPPGWAFWLWALRAVLLVFVARRARAHDALAHERDAAVAKSEAARREAAVAVEALRSAEARRAELRAPVETARGRHEQHEKKLGETERTLADLFSDSTRLREALTQHREERQRRYFDRLAILCAGTLGNSVVKIEIDYPAKFLPRDVAIVDVAGIASESLEAREHAWNVIREEADGCILLSEMQRGVSGPTRKFLQLIREIVPHVVLVMTKMDRAFVEAMRKREGEPWKHVEQARRIGTRRFARDVGRDAETVLSVAISAESALKPGAPSGLGRRFATETSKMFHLLRHERALMLGARSALTVRGCIAQIAEAKEYAERKYQARIAALEARRIPEPAKFRAEQIEAAQADVARGAAEALRSALELLRRDVGLVRAYAHDRIGACTGRAGLREETTRLELTIGEGLERAYGDAHAHLAAEAEQAVTTIEERLFAGLRERYDLVHHVARASLSRIELPRAPASAPAPFELAALGEATARSFVIKRVGLGVGGAALGAAAAGTAGVAMSTVASVALALSPVLAAAAGAMVGALLALSARFGAAKAKYLAAFDLKLGERQAALIERLQAAEAVAATAMHARIERSTGQVLERYGRWIAEPVEAERAAIEEEREKLKDIQRLRERLDEHDARLETLRKAAVDTSLGLCR